MGIKIGDILVKKEIQDNDLKDRIIAFDGYNVMYQFLSSIRDKRGYLLTTPEGRVVSHLKGLFNRNCNLIGHGVRPIFIFDGKPHELKTGVLDLRRERKELAEKEWQAALEAGDLKRARMKAQQTSRITNDMLDDAKYLLKLMGIPYITARGEGEAQAAYMCSKNIVYAVASQDYDSILFGASKLLRNLALSERRKLPKKDEWIKVRTEIIDLSENLIALNINREQLIDLAIMVGTDFNEGIKGIGPKKALHIIRTYGSLEEAIDSLKIPPIEFDEIRRIFLSPAVNEDFNLSSNEIDTYNLIEFLHDELGFSTNGILNSLNMLNNIDKTNFQTKLEKYI